MNEKNKKEIVRFFEKYNVQKIKKNQIISDGGKEVVWIKAGFVRLFKKNKDGRETTLPVLKSAFDFSLLNLFNGTNYQMEAINNLEVYKAPAEDFVAFINENEDLKNELSKNVEKALIETIDAYQKIVDGDAYTKTAILIKSMMSSEDEKKEKLVEINFAIPHRLLASMTGLTRETVTLQLLKMQKEGLITTNVRKLVIKDVEKLNELTNL